MKIKRDPIHDKLVAVYQSLEASVLNQVLKKKGIDNSDLRREILSDFLFDIGIILDQYWFEEEGKKYYPGVYFSTNSHERIEDAEIYLPSKEYGMNFHDYAYGAVDWAIDNESGGPDKIIIGTD